MKMFGLTRGTSTPALRTVCVSLPTNGRVPPLVRFGGVKQHASQETPARERRLLRYNKDGPTGSQAPHVSLRSIPHPDLRTVKNKVPPAGQRHGLSYIGICVTIKN